MTAPFEAYAALICDLDGVVYRGQAAVPHAVEALSAQRRPVLYATNNAARTPDVVAAHLRELGLAVEASDVVNSSQAAAWLLARHQPPGAGVLAVGGPGVGVALREAGFQVVERIGAERVDAVVQGYGPTVTASDLAEAAYGVQGGALWVATNLDSTLPTDRGVAPGGGSLVDAVVNAVGRRPDLVAGKPETPIYELCADRLALPPQQVLAIGDRLETDIAGANSLGMDSLVVLTGVDDLSAIIGAPAALRPTHVARDLSCLMLPAAAAECVRLTDEVKRQWAAVDRASDPGAHLRGLDVDGLLRTVTSAE